MAAAGSPLCGLPPDKLAQAVALSHWRTGIYFGGTAWLVLALALLVYLRMGASIARLASRVSSRGWVQGLVAALFWLLILSALEIPASLLGHHVSLRFGLSIEGWAAWWVDWLKSTVLSLLLGVVVLGILYALMRWSPRRWWLWFWAFTVPVIVLLTFVSPLRRRSALQPLHAACG